MFSSRFRYIVVGCSGFGIVNNYVEHCKYLFVCFHCEECVCMHFVEKSYKIYGESKTVFMKLFLQLKSQKFNCHFSFILDSLPVLHLVLQRPLTFKFSTPFMFCLLIYYVILLYLFLASNVHLSFD